MYRHTRWLDLNNLERGLDVKRLHPRGQSIPSSPSLVCPSPEMVQRLSRVAVVEEDRCKPKKCGQECKRNCPVVKIGKLQRLFLLKLESVVNSVAGMS